MEKLFGINSTSVLSIVFAQTILVKRQIWLRLHSYSSSSGGLSVV